MTDTLLLPYRLKRIGWFILIPAFVCGIMMAIKDFDGFDWLTVRTFTFIHTGIGSKSSLFSFATVNITNTIVGSLCIIGGMIVAFSKEKREDEFIAKLRLSSLLWAVGINYILLLFAFLFVYGIVFFNIMVYNMFTILIIFIIRFHYMLYKHAKSLPDEK